MLIKSCSFISSLKNTKDHSSNEHFFIIAQKRFHTFSQSVTMSRTVLRLQQLEMQSQETAPPGKVVPAPGEPKSLEPSESLEEGRGGDTCSSSRSNFERCSPEKAGDGCRDALGLMLLKSRSSELRNTMSCGS